MPIEHGRQYCMTVLQINGNITLKVYLNLCCLLQAIARRAQPKCAHLTSPPTRTASITDEDFAASARSRSLTFLDLQ